MQFTFCRNISFKRANPSTPTEFYSLLKILGKTDKLSKDGKINTF